MEIDMFIPRVANARRITTVLDRTTLLKRGIRISDPNKFMWI
jgi:hypothetical protein